jgi:HAD superfamily hydrolase (TIGR01509 family)
VTRITPPRQPPAAGPVVFDCDGVLLDTEAAWTHAYTILFARYRTPLRVQQRQALLGRSLETVGRLLEGFLRQPGHAEPLATEALRLARTELRHGTAPLPGATDLVGELRGRRPLAVASNATRHHLLALLETAQLADAFEVIVGGDEVAAPKPAPDLYLHACRQLHTDPATAIAVEDSPAGIRSARTAGLYVIAIPPPPQPVAVDADLLAGSLAAASIRTALRLPPTPR